MDVAVVSYEFGTLSAFASSWTSIKNNFIRVKFDVVMS